MNAAATTLLSYLWHYLLARLLYDDLVRPLAAGNLVVGIGLIAAVAALALAARGLRRSGYRRGASGARRARRQR